MFIEGWINTVLSKWINRGVARCGFIRVCGSCIWPEHGPWSCQQKVGAYVLNQQEKHLSKVTKSIWINTNSWFRKNLVTEAFFQGSGRTYNIWLVLASSSSFPLLSAEINVGDVSTSHQFAFCTSEREVVCSNAACLNCGLCKISIPCLHYYTVNSKWF